MNQKLLTILLTAFLMHVVSLQAQELSLLDVSITFNDRELAFPQAGGLISPQFSTLHLDEDGVEDLFIFDRGGDNILCFLNRSEDGNYAYEYAPEYAGMFPRRLNSWVKIRDYNQDGIGDIFCAPTESPVPGLEVWKGSRDQEGRLHYELVEFDVGDYDVLNFLTNNIYTPVYCAVTDIPGIIDVDGDEDLDIFTFDPGGGLMQLYLNRSVDEGYRLDTFVMEVSDRCWGKFLEDDFSELIITSDDPGSCARRARGEGSTSTRHAGSTILAFDQDNDGAMDLVLGDLASRNLSFLKNGGNNENGWITSVDAQYPVYDAPVDMNIFLASYMMDVNRDGREDLIATQNTRGSGENKDHVWLYLGQEDNEHVFSLEKKDFLVDDMLTIGGASYPALGDYDADGDLDLIIGVNGIINQEGFFDSRIHLFENVSSGGNLSFIHREDDYLEMNSKALGSGRFAPAIGDLDGDGDDDIIVGDRSGKLTYFENTAGQGMPYAFEAGVGNYASIDLRQNTMPQIIDLNEDGLGDLVVGERNDNKLGDVFGGLNFFLNRGGVGEPEFNGDPEAEGNTSVLGGVFTRDPGFTVGASSPGFIKVGDDFNAWVGSESGKLRRYTNIAGNLDGIFDGGEEDFLPYSLGRNSTVIPADLNGDDMIELVIGTSRGGVHIFTSDVSVGGSSVDDQLLDAEMYFYPNPTTGIIQLNTSVAYERIEVFDLNGRKVLTTTDKVLMLESKGTFIARVITKDGVVAKKIINL
jgi:hypothetical protein